MSKAVRREVLHRLAKVEQRSARPSSSQNINIHRSQNASNLLPEKRQVIQSFSLVLDGIQMLDYYRKRSWGDLTKRSFRRVPQKVPPTRSASKHTVAVWPDLPVSSASLHVSAILLTNVCTSLVKISAFLCWPWLVHSETDSLTRSLILSTC
jgi:hypothetical protein